MTGITREARLLETFAVLADTLVDDFDVVDLMQTLVDRCQELLDASQAGILIAGPGDNAPLHVVASTDERSQLIELMQLGPDGGPCVESFRTGRAVALPDLADTPDRWSRFRRQAEGEGFHALHAFPLRLREVTIGSLNLFGDQPRVLSPNDAVAAQAMADVATIGVLQQRAIAEGDVVRVQLQRALDSRIVIEQAKGVVAYSRRVSIDEAFAILRDHARAHGQPLTAVARAVVDRSLAL